MLRSPFLDEEINEDAICSFQTSQKNRHGEVRMFLQKFFQNNDQSRTLSHPHQLVRFPPLQKNRDCPVCQPYKAAVCASARTCEVGQQCGEGGKVCGKAEWKISVACLEH